MAAVLALAVAACGSKESKTETKSTGSGSATSMAGGSAGSGSATSMAGGSGSAATMAGGSDGSASMTGSAGSAVAMTGSAGSAGSAGGGSDDFDFDKLDHKAQADFMKQHVLPDMKIAFQQFDAKKFATFDCKTCHGKDPKAVHFKMPTPDLPKLDFAAIQAGKQAPKTAEFMEKTVEPQMAKILHKPVFDMKTKTGFGCLGCHEQKK
nr:hypothetical protein [Kofleriaceae bacterium]